MGSSAGYVRFDDETFSTLTGELIPIDDTIIQYYGENPVTGEIDSFVAFFQQKNTDAHGTINYILNGEGKTTTFFFRGCTLDWYIENDSEKFHPNIYKYLYSASGLNFDISS